MWKSICYSRNQFFTICSIFFSSLWLFLIFLQLFSDLCSFSRNKGCALLMSPLFRDELPNILWWEIKCGSGFNLMINNILYKRINRLVDNLKWKSAVIWSFLCLIKGFHETIVNWLACVLVLNFLNQKRKLFYTGVPLLGYPDEALLFQDKL